MEIQAKHPTIGTLLSLIDGKVFSGGNDLKLLHFRPNYFMCQYRVTSKGLALVVLSELGGHAPPPPRFGQISKPYPNQGKGGLCPAYLLPGFSDLPTALPGAWPGTLV